MWPFGGRPRRDLPPVNYSENSDSEEEDFEAGLAFASPLQSPRRPLPTREGSPTRQVEGGPTLADNVDDDLEELQYKLHDIAVVREEVEEITDLLNEVDTRIEVNQSQSVGNSSSPVEEVGQVISESGLIFQQPQEENLQVPPVNQDAIMVNYDMQNEDDDAGAINNARDVKLPFNKHDIRLWFSLMESKMQFAGIKKQWSKRQILVQLIPPEFHSDFKQYLVQQEDQAGNVPYYTLKTAIIKQFGPKRAEGFDKAISRVMTDTPSHLGRQILGDICPNVSPLNGCHCADIVLGIWRRALPQVVRNSIADLDFNSTTFGSVFDKADSIWQSNAAATPVSAVLAGVSRGQARGRARGGQRGSGRGGRGRGGQQGDRDRGPRHADQPPSQSCNLHWKFGKGAWKCGDRHTCPWRDYESPKPRHNRNIVSETEMEVVD